MKYYHTYQQKKNITELNEITYVGAKLVREKIGVLLKNTNRKSKTGWKIWLETHIRNLRKQVKMITERKNAETC